MIDFHHFSFNPLNGVLHGPDSAHHLSNRAALLLEVLIAKAPDVLSREQLHGVIWPGETVSDSALYGAINELRTALADDPRKPRFIRTVPRSGYQWIFPMEQEVAGYKHVAATGGGAVEAKSGPELMWVWWCVMGCLALCAACFWAGRQSGRAIVESENWRRKGVHHYRAGRFLEAEAHFRTSLELDAANQKARLGQILSRQGRGEPAETLLDEARVWAERRDDPGLKLRVFVLSGREAMISDDSDKALKWLERAVGEVL